MVFIHRRIVSWPMDLPCDRTSRKIGARCIAKEKWLGMRQTATYISAHFG